MSLEDHICSLELAKKWKEIGGRQDTEFYWNPSGRVVSKFEAYGEHFQILDGFIAAPLASEIWSWLPEERSTTASQPILKLTLEKRYIGYIGGKGDGYMIPYDNLPNALMMMAIGLKEKV